LPGDRSILKSKKQIDALSAEYLQNPLALVEPWRASFVDPPSDWLAENSMLFFTQLDICGNVAHIVVRKKAYSIFQSS
jgi:hypothetical protein